MSKALNKTVAVILCIVMLLGIAPLSGFMGLELPNFFSLFSINSKAEYGTFGGFYYETTADGVSITGCDEDAGEEIVIPNIIEGYPVLCIDEEAFVDCDQLVSITIPNGVTTIGDSAFSGCTELVDITIPDSITSIGESAFLNTGYYKNSENWQNDVLYIGNHLVEAKDSVSGSYTIKDGTICIANEAFSSCGLLTGITIPDSVKSIGHSAFSECAELASVTIGDGVTYIGTYSFYGCDILASLTIGNSVTSIGESAFEYCSNLNSIIIPDSVETIGDVAFNYCSGLTSITIPNSVTNIGYDAFYECTGLTNVNYTGTLAEWCSISFSSQDSNPVKLAHTLLINNVPITEINAEDLLGLSSIGDFVFFSFTNLTSITIPENITTIGYCAFSGCTGLTSVNYTGNLAAWCNISFKDNPLYYAHQLLINNVPVTEINAEDLFGVTTIGDSAFSGCTELTSITIPDGVTSIGYDAFSGCAELREITIPVSVTSIGHLSFYKCTGLRSVNYTGTLTDWCNIAFASNISNPLDYAHQLLINNVPVTDIKAEDLFGATSIGDYSFMGCNLTSITIPNSVTNIGDYAFYGCTELADITIPDSITSIGERAFYDCTELADITIPNSVTSIGESAFFNTEYYKNSENWQNDVLYIGNHLIEAKDSISGSYTIKDGTICIANEAFSSCDLLTCITIPDSVTILGDSAFFRCSGLESVTIGDGVTYIGTQAFYECFTLNNVTIGNSVTSIGDYAFYDCNNLGSITIPDSVTDIGEWAFYHCEWLNSVIIGNSVTSIGDYAFYWCCWLSDIIIGNSVTSIGDYAFVSCIRITSITIPDSVISIGESAFSGCTGLTSITIPDSVTNIGDGVFHECKNLTSVTISNSITNIGAYAFYICYGLDDVYYYGTKAEWCEIIIEEGNELLLDAKIHYLNEPHIHEYTSTVTKEPSCKEEGIRTFICECGDTYTEPIDKIAHTPLTVTIPASCTVDGTSYIICSECGEPLSGYTPIPATGHHYDNGVITKEPTCKEAGVKTFTCTCGNSYTEPVGKLAHTPEVITVPATCTEDGVEFTICSVCEEKLSEDTVLPATGHHYDNGVITKEPTCKEAGVKTFTCTCGDSYTKPVGKIDHTPEVITVPATCTEDGVEFAICSVCEEKLSEDIVLPATGHHYDNGVITKEPICNEAGVKTFTCTCGDSYTEPVGKLNHNPGNWETEIEPTENEEGKAVIKCTLCGEVLDEKVLPKLEVVKDEGTGIELVYDGENYDNDVDINVVEIFDGKAYSLVNTQTGSIEYSVYDVTMLVNGEEKQPNGKVKVKIPLPEGYDPAHTFVYHINTANNAPEKMNAVYQDGYMVFETDHFSYYAIVDETPPANPTANAKLIVKSGKVYKNSKVTVIAKASGIPDGYFLAIYDGGKNPVATGDNASVKYEIPKEVSNTKTLTVKVIDKDGNVQKDAGGKDLSENIEIKIKQGFLNTIIAFFKKLFRSNTAVIKP